jgi:hypothetical protein
MPAAVQADIMGSLQDMFRDMFTWMNMADTRALVAKHTTLTKVPPPVPETFRRALAS